MEQLEATYEAISGNADAPPRRRRKLAVLALVVLIAVILTATILLTTSGGKPAAVERTPELPALQWSDGCLKSVPICPNSFASLPPPLLLVSIDGFRPDYLLRGLTPTLQKLSSCGVRTPYVQPVFPSKTFPNHFSQVTGLYPAWHGIVDNFMNDTRSGKIFKLGKPSILEPFWWEAEPIWTSAVKQGKKAATFFWPGSDVQINGMRPTYYRNYSTSVPFEERVDQVHRWLDLPAPDRPALLTLYLHEPDAAAHQHGIHSKEVDEALVRVDAIIERLFAGLQVRNLTDCVNVFIMSDHGMADVDCSRVVNVGNEYVGTEGPVGRLQVANASVESVLRELRCRDTHMRVYSKEQLPVRMHYSDHRRIEPILIDVDSGWTLLRKKAEAGDSRCSGGTHGYDNLFPDMRAFFTAIGPSLKRNFSAEPFINIELYELMCEMIEIQPNPNNGTRGSLHHLLRAPRRPLEDEEEAQLPPTAFAKHDPRAADCPCQAPSHPEVNTSTSLHAPFGVPSSTAESEHLLLLHNTNYLLAYCTRKKAAVWAAFSLPPKTTFSNSSIMCWTGDPRVPADKSAKCTDYDSDSFKEKAILQRPLYFRGAEPDASFVSNSIPKSLNHTALEGKMISILDRWSSEEGPIHVITGPASFENAQQGALPVPTHLFYVITWCSDETDDVRNCGPDRLMSTAFLLPNWPFPINCETAEKTLKENEARVVEVEKLAGLSFYRSLPVYEAMRLRTSLPTDHWRAFA